MIIPKYKRLGASTHQLAKQIGDQHGEKATHTGTLDPMAEGIVVVLTGEDRFHKEQYANWKKTYQFEILVGFTTDSHDLLGLVVEEDLDYDHQKTHQDIETILPTVTGTYHQKIPTFSAKRIYGESYFDKAKRNENLPTETNTICVDSMQIVQSSAISIQQLQQTLPSRISKVEGRFRQEEITHQWQTLLQQYDPQTSLLLLTLEATTSKRTYIRGIVRDIGQELGTPITTYSIIRTQNGPFRLSNNLGDGIEQVGDIKTNENQS